MTALDEDDELIVRYFGLRWGKSVQDVVHESQGREHLAFDDLLLANDIAELAQATGAAAI